MIAVQSAMELFMTLLLRPLAFAALGLIYAMPAIALDMPPRKPGLWELKMDFEGRKIPATVMKQCTDATSDKVMNSNFGGPAQEACSKQDVTKTTNGMIVDSVCKFGEGTTTTHAVITGNFDSAYTVEVQSKREGGRPVPGMPADGSSHMTITAKWLGSCAAGQKPGDVVMANGMTMNMLDMQKMMPPKKP
jgi:hypothetical protein